MTTASLIDDQKTYFTTLHHLVKPFTSKKGGQQMLTAQTESLRKQVMKNQQITRYVGDKFPDQLQKIFGDYTGQTLGRLDVQKKAAEEEENNALPSTSAVTWSLSLSATQLTWWKGNLQHTLLVERWR